MSDEIMTTHELLEFARDYIQEKGTDDSINDVLFQIMIDAGRAFIYHNENADRMVGIICLGLEDELRKYVATLDSDSRVVP